MEKSNPMNLRLLLSPLLVVVACAGTPASFTTSFPSRFPSMEQRIYELVNAHRTEIGLRPLQWSETAAIQCRLHSSRMATTDTWLGHKGFDDRVDAIAEHLRYRRAGENVANNSGFDDPVTAVFSGWLESPDHRRNIEGDFDSTGTGSDRSLRGYFYYTQIFLKR